MRFGDLEIGDCFVEAINSSVSNNDFIKIGKTFAIHVSSDVTVTIDVDTAVKKVPIVIDKQNHAELKQGDIMKSVSERIGETKKQLDDLIAAQAVIDAMEQEARVTALIKATKSDQTDDCVGCPHNKECMSSDVCKVPHIEPPEELNIDDSIKQIIASAKDGNICGISLSDGKHSFKTVDDLIDYVKLAISLIENSHQYSIKEFEIINGSEQLEEFNSGLSNKPSGKDLVILKKALIAFGGNNPTEDSVVEHTVGSRSIPPLLDNKICGVFLSDGWHNFDTYDGLLEYIKTSIKVIESGHKAYMDFHEHMYGARSASIAKENIANSIASQDLVILTNALNLVTKAIAKKETLVDKAKTDKEKANKKAGIITRIEQLEKERQKAINSFIEMFDSNIPISNELKSLRAHYKTYFGS